MNFIKKLHILLDKYDSPSCDTRCTAFLYGVRAHIPPLATHIVFAPMPYDVKQNLIDNYKYTIPTDLLTLYSTMNGADLFWNVRIIGKKNTRIPFSRFSIYGVPLTWDRKHIEPFNICIEDLNRPHGIPDTWLKFGSYYKPENIINRLDLFADTESNAVYAVEHDCTQCVVSENWNSIDDCLCDLIDLLDTGASTEQDYSTGD